MTTLRLPAPAKINTFLHIIGRRSDGYHLLETNMVLVSLADTVSLTLRSDGAIRLIEPPEGITAANDLACRAARALQQATGTAYGVDIQLTKRIPQGAGLGGGSSDAATALLGLNRLWALKLSRDRLMEIGLGLGADVPFFVFGRPALATGVGERLCAMTAPQATLVLAHPGVGVATAAAFAHPLIERNTAPMTNSQFNWVHGVNNIERAASHIQPLAHALSLEMQKCCNDSRMSGSGSAYFARVASVSEGNRVVTQLKKAGHSAWVVRSISRHPLHDFA